MLQPNDLQPNGLHPAVPIEALRQADRLWSDLRAGTRPVPQLVTSTAGAGGEQIQAEPEYDVVICGATLGVVLGALLAMKGWRVALVERGQLRGRDQEWNISRRELATLTELGLLTAAELAAVIASSYNPARIAFHGGPEFWVTDVLNVGVDPVGLLDRCKAKFLAAGGTLLERCTVTGLQVAPGGVAVHWTASVPNQDSGQEASAETGSLTARLVLDMMGHFSPIAQQARAQAKSSGTSAKPEGVCLVVGSCATGFAAEQNLSGDLMVSRQPIENHCQYFWEAFPAREGRTTYLFTYLDAHPDRPSLESLMADYLRLLPEYQQVTLEQLDFKRFLFGVLPSYQDSPLAPAWDRILQVGDSSGTQSPLSFGGFGALLRHLDRLVTGLDDALRADCVQKQDLALLNPYQPNLAVTWLFQRAMSVGLDKRIAPNQINQLLSHIFGVMDRSGEATLKPFLQDVVQFGPLAKTMLQAGISNPWLVSKVLPQVGLVALIDWSRHYASLATYSALQAILPEPPPGLGGESRDRFRQVRWFEALLYGSGKDYH